MPSCYFLAACGGSSVDQQSNNVTLFNLVEQINVPPGTPPPPHGAVPLEVHAYFRLDPGELGRDFEVRFVMVASSGLETPSDGFVHRAVTPRFRTRTVGLPFPPVAGDYELRVDWRYAGTESWTRESIVWPIGIVETAATPRVTH